MSPSNVCLVIDFDGFHLDKKFHVREMGFTSLTSDYKGCHRFKLDHLADRATPKDWKTIDYCTDRVHGLTLGSWPGEHLFREETLRQLVQIEYEEARTFEKYLVAFKGGHVERDLLEELQIPHVDLEDFGCPKFDDLQHPMKSMLKDCGYHRKLKRAGAVAHCAKVECFLFAEWVKGELE